MGSRSSKAEESGPRVAVIDSGVRLDHPHLEEVGGQVSAGPTIHEDGVVVPHAPVDDAIGHGTAVTAAIVDLAPASQIYVVRVFVEEFSCPFEHVLLGIDAALDWGADLINLSLGTTMPDYCRALTQRLARATESGARLVAPVSAGGFPSYPGSLEGAVAVVVDSNRTRAAPELREIDGRSYWFASPHPRAIADVPRRSNWSGASFAVANVTGHLASAIS